MNGGGHIVLSVVGPTNPGGRGTTPRPDPLIRCPLDASRRAVAQPIRAMASRRTVSVVRTSALLFSMVLIVVTIASPAEATGPHRRSTVAPSASSRAPSTSGPNAAGRPANLSSSGESDWPAYLFGTTHSSDNSSATAITTANASSLNAVWNYVPTGSEPLGNVIWSSPTVYDGQVYIGSDNGTFYDLNETTGAVVWSHFTKQQQRASCEGGFGQGFVSTATVAISPKTGRATVYVAAPSGYLDAWDASNGRRVWRSVIALPSKKVNNYFDWSSPTVANGKIYVGVASNCSDPLVRGGEKVYDQATGHLLATFSTVPPHDVGGGIWSSALVTNDGSVYVTTGNPSFSGQPPGYSESIIRLDPQTLQVDDHWTIPSNQQVWDGDFGASATVWTADLPTGPTQMVGAVDKNGNFYALNASDLAAGPVWVDNLGYSFPFAECISAGVWDPATGQLFLSGPEITVNGTTYNGSVEEVDPATGATIWQTALPAAVTGTPTLDGAGVLAVPTMSWASGESGAVYLLNASNGQILATVNTDGTSVFSQPVFAESYLFVATEGEGIMAFEPSPSTNSAQKSRGGR